MRELQRDIQDVKDAVNLFATATEKQFNTIENQLDGMDHRFDTLEGRTGRIETSMLTKAYFDVRMGTLVDILSDHRVITPSEAKRVLS